MKKRIILLIFLIVLLAMPFASASIFDWIAEITGRATTEDVDTTVKTESTIIKEQVKCVFLNSNSEQKCYSSDGNFGCFATESCLVGVSGEKGKTLIWKSTCGSEAYTTIDGSDEYIEFKCEQVAVQAQTTTATPVQEVNPVQEVKEQVKCTFLNSNTEQKCYTSDGKFVCSGTGSCLAGVYGAMGTKLEWKSSCGGYANTLIDGNSENAEFKCETAPTTAIPVPTATTAEVIKEQVKCIFSNSNSEQKCYGGEFACSGIGTCIAEVSGQKGTMLTWKSSCGGYAYTVVDGNNDYAEFKCEQIATLTPVPAEIIKEQVKCVFANSVSTQECYGGGGACKGIGTCIAEVSGSRGEKLTWKSSCGGYAYTIIDGNSEYAEFQCEKPAETAFVKEQVKCIFSNSNSEQKCYTDDGRFGCSGAGTCIADVYAEQGKKIVWKSSCSGYAYTVMDGNNDYAEFKCEQASTPTPVPIEIVKEQVKCVFTNSNSEQKCGANTYYNDKFAECSGVGTCVVDVVGERGKMLTWKSSCGGYAYTVIDGNNDYAEFKCEQTTPITIDTCKDSDGFDYFLKGYVEVNHGTFTSKDFDTCRVINSNTDYYDTGECSGANCYVLESSCAAEHGTFQSRAWKCPNECKDGACIKAEVREQVRCIFSDPELIQRCYADMGKLGCENIARKCYTDDGKFECSEITVASTPVDGGFKYVPFCIAEVSGYVGTKLTWKSSCGGYGYTVIDGNHEDVGFDCVTSSNVTPEQISGKGFLHAYWQCYDGTEEKSIEGVELTTCKSSEIWQEYAKKFCENRCNKEGAKCGVNSFSVLGECYIDVAKGGVIFAAPEKHKEGKKFAMPPNSKIGDIMVVYFYSDTCRYCSGMDEELDKVSKELNIDIKRINVINIKRINVINEPEFVESYNIKGVPAFLVLRYESDGIKEFIRYGKADSTAIINWVANPATEVPEKTAEIEKLKEEILICKDSCPLDGKCYPFGYRKTGKYCYDEGAFKEQLKDNAVCENNFECQTNVCVDGKCISSGVINKVLSWFKRLFGAG